MSNSSLSDVVSNLVRAQMGASIPDTVTDEELDRHVADLIIKEAKQKAEQYLKTGVRAYLPDPGPDPNAPKTNKRFLAAIIRNTDEHNRAVLKAQADAAAEAKAEKDEQARHERMARAKEATEAGRLRRLMGSSSRRRDDSWSGSQRDKRDRATRTQELGRRDRSEEDEDDYHRRRRHRRRSESPHRQDRDDDYNKNSSREFRRKRSTSRSLSGGRRNDGSDRRRRRKRDNEKEGSSKRRNRGEKDDRDRGEGSSRRYRHRSKSRGSEELERNSTHKRRHDSDSEGTYGVERKSYRSGGGPRYSLQKGEESATEHKRKGKEADSAKASSLPTPRNVSANGTPRASSSREPQSEEPLTDDGENTTGPLSVAAQKQPTTADLSTQFRQREAALASPPLPASPTLSEEEDIERLRPRRRKRVSPKRRSQSPNEAGTSKMDKYFEESYDPRLDIGPLTIPTVPSTGLIEGNEFERWEAMLEIVRQRRDDKAERKRMERLGITKDREKSQKPSEAWTMDAGVSIMDIQYSKRGSVREWDKGKEGF